MRGCATRQQHRRQMWQLGRSAMQHQQLQPLQLLPLPLLLLLLEAQRVQVQAQRVQVLVQQVLQALG